MFFILDFEMTFALFSINSNSKLEDDIYIQYPPIQGCRHIQRKGEKTLRVPESIVESRYNVKSTENDSLASTSILTWV